MRFVFTFITALFITATLTAQVSPYEVKSGTALRKTILNSIRTPTEAELGQKVEFVVSAIMSKGNWAFANGSMQQPGGKELDFSKIQDKDLKMQIEEGMFDNNFQAVLRKKGKTWVVVERAIGCTDVCWLAWKDLKGVPAEIFPE